MSRVFPCPRWPTTAACRTSVGVSIKEAMNSGEHRVSGSFVSVNGASASRREERRGESLHVYLE